MHQLARTSHETAHQAGPRLSVTLTLVAAIAVGISVAQQEPQPATADPADTLEVTEQNARSIEAYNAAILAAQEGRLIESITMLEAFIAAAPPEALKTKAVGQLELIRAERRKQHVVEFNEAVRLLKKRQFEPAEALLRGILDDGPTEKMLRSVTKQLGVIERAKPRRHLIADDESSEESSDEPTPKKKKKKKRD